MKFRLGFLGAWALFVIGVILAAAVAGAEWQNWRDVERLRKLRTIDQMIAERLASRMDVLKEAEEERGARVERLRNAVREADVKLDDSQDTKQTIVVSTAENRLSVRRAGKTIFKAVCSTGKGTTLTDSSGRTIVFETPTGKFHVVSKEENPVWVPPDWHFLEEARKKKKAVIRLNPGDAIDAATGEPVPAKESGGVWGSVDSRSHSGRVLKIRNNSVVEVSPDGSERELPPGKMIEAGNAIVVPPTGAPQRRFDKVLGKYRLNIGSGYGIHGTLATDQLGRSVSHGCVRLGDADMERLFSMAQAGDQVLIY
jgi:lipoprotein-anchoring transpeptidase ErfK/SrfK